MGAFKALRNPDWRWPRTYGVGLDADDDMRTGAPTAPSWRVLSLSYVLASGS
jgi:hypothetical protein